MTPNHSDVLVIGGGAVGLACAHYLAQAGRTVCIIEQDTVGAGASHGNCGLVVASYLMPLCVPGVVRKEFLGMLRRSSPLYIKPTLDPDVLGWLLKFAGRCRTEFVQDAIRARERLLTSSDRLFQELFRDHALEAEYERRGCSSCTAPRRPCGATKRRTRSCGLSATPPNPWWAGRCGNWSRPCGRMSSAGWYHATDSHLRPDRLLRSWKQALIGSGVRIEENCRLERFRSVGDRVAAAVTPKGEFSAREVVLAAGAWSAPIAAQLELRLPLQPGKGYSITMARPAVCPRIPCSFAEKRVVATPWPSGYRLGGTMEFSGFSTALDPRRLAALTAAAGEYLTDPVGHPVVEEWTGLRPMTYDDLPVIGRAPRCRNLILATGHGMLGITTAPATGKLVAEIVCGASPHIDPGPFSVSRFQ